MDRSEAIRKARYFRVGATVINCDSGREIDYTGTITDSRIDGTAIYKTFLGHPITGPRYRRMTEQGPSVAAAKRAVRALQTVGGKFMPHLAPCVVQERGENLRAVAMARIEAEAARKAAEDAAKQQAAA